ncbi:hypothetical protein EYF80_030521 [Liparis tanakae]|uniref:Uncharacterized protein n=1 Tax=Liparis tanakae TaxID=230148 RepID=A0A4Z2H0E9_9TELE|nr:hypothetical protein EYF80_030521 [Liparis tanakae]
MDGAVLTSSRLYCRSSLPMYSRYEPFPMGDSWLCDKRYRDRRRASSYLVGPGPLDLGPEVLHRLVQAPVAAQLGLHRGQVGAPLGLVDAQLVLLHPGQEVLDVADGHVIHLGPDPPGALLRLLRHGHLGGRDGGLQPEVVVGAQVDHALVEPVDPEEKRTAPPLDSDPRRLRVSLFARACDSARRSPAVHLLGLKVAPVLE